MFIRELLQQKDNISGELENSESLILFGELLVSENHPTFQVGEIVYSRLELV